MTTDRLSERPNDKSIRRLRSALDRLVAGAGTEDGRETWYTLSADGGSKRTDLETSATSGSTGALLDVRFAEEGHRHTGRVLQVAACLCLVALLAGVVIWTQSSPESAIEVGDEPPPPVASNPTRPPEPTIPAVEVAAPEVDLALPGATVVREETSTPTDNAVTTWYRDDASAFLSLDVRPGFGGYVNDVELADRDPATRIPADEGTAWFTTDEISPDGHPAMGLLWSRPNGDLWALDADWSPSDTRSQPELSAELERWALAIDIGPAGYELADSTMLLLGANSAGPLGSRYKVWTVGGHEVQTLALQRGSGSGPRNLLSAAGWPVPYPVGDKSGWIVRHAAGAVLAVATGARDGTWVTVQVPEALGGQTDAIASALQVR